MVDTMAFVRVAARAELPPGALRQFIVRDTPLALCNDAGAIHAFYGLCPHHNGPLGQGNLVDGNIVCPWHAWEFSVATGEYDRNAAVRLRRFPVRLDGEDIVVDLDEIE